MPADDDTPKAQLFRVRAHGKRVQFSIDDPADFIQASILKTKKFYEQDLLDEIFHRVLPGMRFVDVGANIGNHSVFMGGVAGMGGTAIEPFLPNFQRLKENLAVNGLGRTVAALNLAIGSKPGRAKLASMKETNTGTAAFAEVDDGDVEVQPLDDLDLGPFQILKIDVEGMELDVLEGARKAIQKNRPLIICEAQTVEHFEKIRALLAELDYRPTRRYCVTPTYFFEPA